MINRTISHYRLEKQLGAGGMGEVYRAQDARLNRSVAIKILPAEFASDQARVKRFTQEARAASALNHPNVCHIYEIDECEGIPFIAMELIEGKSLAEKLEGSRKAEVSEIVSVGMQAADALDKAHSLGIIHRDIKPNNIMITDSNQVKVVDFGLARMSPNEHAGSQLTTATETEPGAVLGTVPYMSPEQALGKKVDARTDLFSLGVVLYQMATSRRPFEGGNAAQIMDQIIHAQPDAIVRFNYGLPPELDRIIRKCLEKDPDRRYQSARELFIDLSNLQRDLQTPAPVKIVHPLRRALLVALLVFLLAVVAFWFGEYFTLRPKPPEGPQRLAVLPFHLLTQDHDIDYLSVGIADSIITRLSNIRQIRLCPTDSILRFQKQPVELAEVQRELKADSVLTGTIQKAADRFRITVQLVRTKDRVTLWGDRYDLAPQDLLKLEDQIAEKVSNSLKITLTANDRERVYRRYTQNSAAYNSYLHGRAEMAAYNEEGVRAAVTDFENSLRLDPNYALAQAGLALASAEMHLRYAPSDEVKQWGERAQKEAEKALQLDPNLAEAHEALAAVYRKTDFDWDATIRESKKAIELNPNLELPHYYIAASFYHLGLLESASREVKRGLENGGRNKSEAFRTQGVVALMLGNYAEAVSKLEEAERLSGKPLSDAYLPHAYFAFKKYEEADAALDKLNQISSASVQARSQAARSVFLAARGEVDAAKQLADSVANGSYIDHHVAYDLGAAYGQLHHDDDALLWLRRSVESGLPCYPLFAQDPLLQPLQSNLQFRQLLGELRDKWKSAHSKYE
jgi:serine/threonine protein kinase/Tfp pilus assembly protein PilF